MELPAFFDEVPRLRMQDPLAHLLGSATDGVLEYGYADAVRLTGHSCPTVASAYWLTLRAMEHLYPDALPQRGNLRVEFREDARTGSTGVVATVVQMLTGAAGSSGFKGLGGRFSRVNLMRYQPDLLLSLRYTRLDTQAAVDADVDLSLVPADPAIVGLVARCGSGKLTADEATLLGRLWQERVQRLLLRFGRDDAVFKLQPVQGRKSAIPVTRATAA